MDALWRDAPWPALRVRRAPGPAAVEFNAAARHWAAAQGLPLAELEAWALARGAAAAVGGPLTAATEPRWRGVVVPLSDGELWWLQPAPPPAAAEPGGNALEMSDPFALRGGAEILAERAPLAAEALGVGFWIRDGDTGQAYWDERMYRIYGLDPAHGPPTLAAWLEHCVHPHDQARMAHQAAQVRAAGLRPEALIEATFRIHDGPAGERWVQTWTRRVLHQGRRMSYGMHVDVSERQRAEQRVERERMRTQLAIDAAGVGVWEREASGLVYYWNEAMYRLRGLRPDDPRSPAEIMAQTVHPDDSAYFAVLRQQHLSGQVPYRHEFRVRLPDGQWRWLATEGQALRDTQGRVLGMAGINIDVTERRNAQRLEQDKQRLEQASRDKSAFMARMSHELRTPMNAVLGFTQLLLDDGVEPVSARQRDRLTHIDAAGRTLMALIDDLLQIAQREVPPAPAPAQAGLRVLCVEDNAVNLQLVREIIALRPAVRLSTAGSGREGIEKALAERPDLVLLDLQLPDQSGLEVMRALRAEPALAGCHIVALSADAMPDHIAAAMAAGFDDYWTKPIHFERFLGGIDRIATERAGPTTAPGAP